MKRCTWAKTALMKKYHDEEWGKPLHDDQALFEQLILETLQAGLSWDTVLKKREDYRAALDQFDPQKIAQYDENKITELLHNPKLIRHPLKMKGIVKNAKAFLAVQKEWGTFDAFLWSYVKGQPMIHHFKEETGRPSKNDLSEQLSKDMKKKGFSFVGPVICYAFLQATGVINDHIDSCSFKY
ncbi:DNA-3-methyladenine glycosylase I [Pisciglobus halotolerans]|uniref:DNA-3-methyladenine glycosylase I n=1 Tax=Pisciglobus halotolerans TaxID=745365 RepID=A0A1I3CVN8_9LACT|nr:DNA-3-methyladenine glycosylase I [Pisciglobus halotolerans]SFH78507.1 DNA-3-methyladenine glycosylase I [Pisciglobus halotolerans]